ncbi:hypothetical protein AB0873_09555 [Micromonospora sp. NPDC047707]|uniref:hypothetical protein n=1 Tax=Micromonospora sp. NPDC047707 TaxID=3154498 RepID=UPI0034540CA3
MNDLRDVADAERGDWQARLEAAVAETLRRRAERRRIREEHQAARTVGLVHRNRARLARARTAPGGATMPTTPNTVGDVLTVDVSDLPDADLASVAGALARVAGFRTLNTAAVLILGQLAQQARTTIEARRDRSRP